MPAMHCEARNRKGTESGLLLILVERYLNLNFRSLLLCAVWPWQKCPIFILFGPYCPYHDCLMYHFVPFMYTHHHHSAWYTSFCRIICPHMHVAEQLRLLHSLWDLSNYLPNYSPFLFFLILKQQCQWYPINKFIVSNHFLLSLIQHNDFKWYALFWFLTDDSQPLLLLV